MHKFISSDNPYVEQALRHSSLGERNYERLEFLGDRVLGLIIAQALYEAFPNESEGDLAKRHTALVQGETLAEIARELELGQHIEFSEAEKMAGGAENDNILADVVEAILGAIYLHDGLDAVTDFVRESWGERIKTMKEPPQDPKTALQEWSQSRSLGLPEYELVGQDGPDHAPMFTIKVSVDGHGTAEATAQSKRQAQKDAAKALLAKL